MLKAKYQDVFLRSSFEAINLLQKVDLKQNYYFEKLIKTKKVENYELKNYEKVLNPYIKMDKQL